jgi:isoquinoline 1-oxidoreductase alpha subunit
MRIQLKVNGRSHSVDVPEDAPVLWVLRDELGFVGTKFGCGIAQCGACTIHVDGVATRSCIARVRGARQSITTIGTVAGRTHAAAGLGGSTFRSALLPGWPADVSGAPRRSPARPMRGSMRQ